VLKLNKCKEILESDGSKYNEEEAQLIVSFINRLAATTVETIKNNNDEEGDHNGSGIK
jgi:hypothetical protein